MSTAGLILSAGESRRMGSPKALLLYGGQTFLDRLVGLLAERCYPVIVVLGAGAAEIEARASRRARFVRNANYRLGQTSSMQCGLRAVPAEADGVLFTLVDHPAVSPETIQALLAAQDGGAGRPLAARAALPGQAGSPGVVLARADPRVSSVARWRGGARRGAEAHAERTGFLDLDDRRHRGRYRRSRRPTGLWPAPAHEDHGRAVLKLAGVAAGALLVAGLAVPYLGADSYGDRLRGSLERALGGSRRVEIGKVHFSLFEGPGFSVDSVVIHEDPAIGAEPIVYIQESSAAAWKWRRGFGPCWADVCDRFHPAGGCQHQPLAKPARRPSRAAGISSPW